MLAGRQHGGAWLGTLELGFHAGSHHVQLGAPAAQQFFGQTVLGGVGGRRQGSLEDDYWLMGQSLLEGLCCKNKHWHVKTDGYSLYT